MVPVFPVMSSFCSVSSQTFRLLLLALPAQIVMRALANLVE